MTGCRRGAVAVVGLVLMGGLVGGCGSTSGGSGSGGGTGSGGSDSAAVFTSAPPTEGPTTEAAQTGGGGTSVSLPSLPIGGDVNTEGAEQCAHVNWLGPKPIPGGVTVALDGFSLDPEGIFRFGGSLCGTDSPVCTPGWQWAADTADLACLVPVVQVAESDRDVTLVLSGTVACAQADACAAFGSLGGSQITFTPTSGVVDSGGGATGGGGGSGSTGGASSGG